MVYALEDLSNGVLIERIFEARESSFITHNIYYMRYYGAKEASNLEG